MSEAIVALLGALHNPALKAIDLSLVRVEKLLTALGNPQEKLPPVIHAAGTNGKGSLLAYLQAICEASGLRAHRYTSPYLVRFNESIMLANRQIGDDTLRGVLLEVQAAARKEPVTLFEACTAAAFLAFARHKADVVLLETGMGGRLDATNVIATPLLTAITPVSVDHAEYLGGMLEKIAAEKAGIIKRFAPCVVGPQQPAAAEVIAAAAAHMQAPFYRYGTEWEVQGAEYRSSHRTVLLKPSLAGRHQIYNAATAIACVDMIPRLGIRDDAITKGIAAAHWPARLQRLQDARLLSMLPAGSELWLDGGHNPDAGMALAEWAVTFHDKPLVLICGMIEGKDTVAFLRPLAPHAQALYAVPIEGEARSQNTLAIASAAAQAGIAAHVAEDAERALHAIRQASAAPCRVLICGSLYLAGKMLSFCPHKPEERDVVTGNH